MQSALQRWRPFPLSILWYNKLFPILCNVKTNVIWPNSPRLHRPHQRPNLSSLSFEHSYTLLPSVSAVKMGHSYPQPASQSPPPPTSEDPIAPTEVVIGDVPPTHLRCPHCPVVLYRRNLFLHIKRKHAQVKDITAQSHLQSTSVHKSNSIFAVQKTSRGFSIPVHVQRKTWGQQQVWDGGLPVIPPAGTAKWPFSQFVPSHQIIRLL